MTFHTMPKTTKTTNSTKTLLQKGIQLCNGKRVSHIDVYMFLRLTKRNFMRPATDATLCIYLQETLPLHCTLKPESIDEILAAPPKTKVLCHALHKHGFSQKWIADDLGITAPTVSQHIHTQVKHGYINPKLFALIEQFGTPNYKSLRY